MSSADSGQPTDLLYPFYLDTDMSMSFAAALTGGVTLEEERTDRARDASEAVRNLRGNINLWRLGALEGGKHKSDGQATETESKLVRHHTVASVFIDLYDELRRTGRVIDAPDINRLRIGQLVSVEIGPAVAPLRRVVDQLVRLLNVMAPVLGDDTEDGDPTDETRQQRRARERAPTKRSAEPVQAEGLHELRQLRRLFLALRDDLDHSGMVDIVVRRDAQPSVVLTLDKRFLTDATLEVLHTSTFTVVGKVTQVWSEANEAVNLYRRSVLALVPSLGQSIAWSVFTLLGTVSRSFDVKAAEQAAWIAVGGTPPEPPATAATAGKVDDPLPTGGGDQESGGLDAGAGPGAEGSATEDVIIGEDVAALLPVVAAPVFQILPLAICS